MKTRTNTEGDWKPILNAYGAKSKRALAGKKLTLFDKESRAIQEYTISPVGHSKNTLKVVGGILYITNNLVVHFPELTINVGKDVSDIEELIATLLSPIIRKEFLLSIDTKWIRIGEKFFQHPLKLKLEDWIGEQVTLDKKPNGSTSQHYRVSVGKKYQVVGVDGSNLLIQISKKSKGHINYNRFKEFQSPA